MDLLVKLYQLPDSTPVLKRLEKRAVSIRRPLAPEKSIDVKWVRDTFSAAWADECEVTFSHSPISSFIAVDSGTLLGFACYDATCKNFFGPTGVDPDFRG